MRLVGIELRDSLEALAESASARGDGPSEDRLRYALKFFIGSMHEFFGESREALRFCLTSDSLSERERQEMGILVSRISEALGMHSH